MYCVVFDISIGTKPLQRAKKLSVTSRTEIWYLFDFEGDTPQYIQRFNNVLNEMSQANKIGKDIIYKCGYSNLSFELWLILHKINCNSHQLSPKGYLKFINSSFGENFNNLSDFKKEKDYIRCLSKLQLSDMQVAIERAKKIQLSNKENGCQLRRNKDGKYTYYIENPSLDIWIAIKKILNECGF